MPNACVARQPIFNRKLHLIGYELLFRDPPATIATVRDAEAATTQVVLNTLTEIGLEQVVGDARAWINVSREFLLSDLVQTLPPDHVVLEILEGQSVDAALIAAIAQLRQQGYRFALDDFHLGRGADALIDHAEWIKLDLLALGSDGLRDHVHRLRDRRVQLLAEKVESHEEHAFARSLGCGCFQGFFYQRPELVSRRRIDPGRASLIRLLARLQEPVLSLREISAEIEHDVALSVRLLRYINSAYLGVRHEITSVGQAVVLLGPVHLRRWATLSTFAGLERQGCELTRTALVRARCCELAGESEAHEDAQRFTLGLFSVLDALTDTPLEEALRPIPFPADMLEALIDRTGELGRLLSSVIALEEGDFARAQELAPECGEVYVEALAWADGVLAALSEPGAPEPVVD